jgi:hypothetical protein
MSAKREKKPPRKLATAKGFEVNLPKSYNQFALRAHCRQDVCAPSLPALLWQPWLG